MHHHLPPSLVLYSKFFTQGNEGDSSAIYLYSPALFHSSSASFYLSNFRLSTLLMAMATPAFLVVVALRCLVFVYISGLICFLFSRNGIDVRVLLHLVKYEVFIISKNRIGAIDFKNLHGLLLHL